MKLGVIYLIKNLVNGKEYVGQTNNFKGRRTAHIRASKKGSGHAIAKAIRKYGEDKFGFKPLLDRLEPKCLNCLERVFIATRGSYKNGYNLTEGGQYGINMRERRPSTGAAIRASWAREKAAGVKRPSKPNGWKHSQATRDRMREIRKGRKGLPHSPETIEKMRASLKGRICSPETRLKLVKAATKRRELGLKRKVSKARLDAWKSTTEARKGRPGANKGSHWSEESKKKQSDPIKKAYADGKRLAIPWSEETRAKITAAFARRRELGLRNKPTPIESEETREKKRQNALGHFVSEETRSKISAARIRGSWIKRNLKELFETCALAKAA